MARRFFSKRDFDDHQQQAHEWGSCSHCGTEYQGRRALAAHVHRAHTEKLCRHCRQKVIDLEGHIRDHHQDELRRA